MSKKEDILNSALNLFVELGFHATPTSKIAKEAKVANGTLFHYFKTKNDLILAIYNSVNANLTEYMFANTNKEDSFKMALKRIFTKSIEWSLYNKQEYLFLQQFSKSPLHELTSSDELNQQTKPFLDFLEQGIKTSVLKPMPVKLLHTLINSHIEGINQYLSSNKHSPEEQQEIINEAFDLLGL